MRSPSLAYDNFLKTMAISEALLDCEKNVYEDPPNRKISLLCRD